MSQGGPITCKALGYTFLFPDEVRRITGKVVLQLPPGLKPAVVELVRCLRRAGVEPIVDMDPTFGSCDLHIPQLRDALGDGVVILHAGHTPYPPELSRAVNVDGARVIYVPVTYDAEVPENVIERAAELIASRGLRKVSVLTTAQHVNQYERVVNLLKAHGVEVIRAGRYPPYLLEGQVLGCDYRVVPRGAEGYVIIAGGLFHGLGLYLATLKPVLQIDPYRSEVRDLTDEGQRFLRLRLQKVSQAIDARRWGVIVGLKTGQYRPWVLNALLASMRHHGREFIVLASDTLTESYLRDVDSEWFQAFVVTSCPRLPIDDLYEYEKPVLTPGEALMALQGKLEPYIFPW
ncbi:MAG: diphthamide biosynthesis enzyme Dph2 [Acidilobus sp.]